MTGEAATGRSKSVRLALRIYLYVAATLLISVFFLGVAVRFVGPPRRDVSLARSVVAMVVTQRKEGVESKRHMGKVEGVLKSPLTIYDSRGDVVFSNVSPPCSALTSHQRMQLLHDGTLSLRERKLVAVGLVDKGRLVAYGLFPQKSPMPVFHGAVLPIVLFCGCLVFTSLLFARSLTKPIGRLHRAAEALGSGDMEARVHLSRRDELGDLGRSFDQMADRIARLLKSQRELLANVSHELRTPMARIRVALDIAAEGDSDKARELLCEIGEDLGEIERLVSDILMAARLDAAVSYTDLGAPPLRRVEVHMVEVTEEAAARFRRRYPDRSLVVELANEIPVMRADQMLLRRVLDNLLDNAHKYSAKNQKVTLLSGSDSNGMWLEVVDEGPGITEADLPHVFEPFYRTDVSRSRSTGGVGLGLTLCKRIVEAHGGSIDMESGEKRGTTVRVWLPKSVPAADV